MKWTENRIPDQTGRLAVITGANAGIGFETARALAAKGARVIMACRSAERGSAARDRLVDKVPESDVELAILDLSDLGSVRSFAADVSARNERVDLLINNAGVMMPAERTATQDGFELQFGVNHLGHFALTGLLLDSLVRTPGSRVITVASAAHRSGRMDFQDPNWEQRPYRRWSAYGQSKLANLLFLLEFDRRLKSVSADVTATAAHPGWTATDLQRHTLSARLLNPLFAMKPWQGALPSLRAAVDPDVKGGEYFGPKGLFEMRGYPVHVDTSEWAKKVDDGKQLWALSEQLTGVRYEQLGP